MTLFPEAVNDSQEKKKRKFEQLENPQEEIEFKFTKLFRDDADYQRYRQAEIAKKFSIMQDYIEIKRSEYWS